MGLVADIVARGMQALARRAGEQPDEAFVADTEAGPLPVRLFLGPGVGDDAPVYIHFPGGDFVTRSDDSALCRQIADALGCVVILADYGLAPQQRFPNAPTQAQALAWWAFYAGRKQGWDGKRIALGGQGAGGNLALGACLELPSRMAFRPLAVAAIAPLLEMEAHHRSWRARVAQAAYLPDRAARAAPLASPLRADADALSVFAPTLIVVEEAGADRADGELFAAMLQAAGREVHLAPLPRAKAAPAEVTAFLARVFDRSGQNTPQPGS